MSDTDVISLTTEDNSCKISNYQNKLVRSTAVFMEDMVVICGGLTSDEFLNKCYKLSKGQTTFKEYATGLEPKAKASSIVIQDEIWITGGVSNGISKKSSEFIKDNSKRKGTDLPEKLFNHIIIKLNEETSMLIGGEGEKDKTSEKTYYYFHANDSWTLGPPLKTGRNRHAAGLIKDKETLEEHIVVMGGSGAEDNVEILFHGEKAWKEGMETCTIE